VEVCHKVKPFTIREQKMLRVAPPKSKVQQRINTKMTTNLRLWLSKLLMNFHKLTIGGCPFSKEHRWRFFSTVTYCQKSEVFMIIIMIGTTFLFCDMGCFDEKWRCSVRELHSFGSWAAKKVTNKL